MKNSPNQLIHETSPYLLQHAYNPVHWLPWSDQALQQAKKEDKPVLVSIGYSACHWCHVMERESFENEATAAYMNQHFINIKIDREERPDLDHIYMDAVQAITGSGGWPLNVFLTPEGKPFYGGTYYPPQRAFNRPSWMELLSSIHNTFTQNRQQVEEQANSLTQHAQQSNYIGSLLPGDSIDEFGVGQADAVFEKIMQQADKEWGGFGKAPKFPQTMVIKYLLRYHHFTGNQEALSQALFSLDKMMQGGLYDHLGGGFARYSTDTEWLAPHFEKMLYDNALLVSVLAEAYQVSANERYKEVIKETIHFLNNELSNHKGGFLAALDADSEGEEGKYYVWSNDEIQAILGTEAAIFAAFYDISLQGNWEHTNILRRLQPKAKVAADFQVTEEKLDAVIQQCRQKLLEARQKRIRPGCDDKIILGWNAMMNEALVKAYEATGERSYLEMAEQNMQWLWQHLYKDDIWFHSWKANQTKHPAFLDDLGSLISALIRLQQATGNKDWLEKAFVLADHVLESFGDEEGIYFYYTASKQEDVIVRKKEIYDGATASGNALMAANLWQLSLYRDKPEWRQRSISMLRGLEKMIEQYPTSFAEWACLLLQNIWPVKEVGIVGEGAADALKEILQPYHPHKVVMINDKSDDNWPLLAQKGVPGKTLFYLCQNFTCTNPVSTVAELIYLMSR